MIDFENGLKVRTSTTEQGRNIDDVSMPKVDTPVISKQEDGNYLFTTMTCPNCKIAKGYLEGIPYEVIDAEQNLELVSEYAIMQAPTLVTIRNGQVKKYVNASNIRKFAEEQFEK